MYLFFKLVCGLYMVAGIFRNDSLLFIRATPVMLTKRAYSYLILVFYKLVICDELFIHHVTDWIEPTVAAVSSVSRYADIKCH